MQGLRIISLLRGTVGWTAIMATILHVVLLSLHVTAAFERGINAGREQTAALGIHAFCGVDFPQSEAAVSPDGGKDPGSGKSNASCPLCNNVSPVACIAAPVADISFVVFCTPETFAYSPATEPRVWPQTGAGSIRGPPAIT